MSKIKYIGSYDCFSFFIILVNSLGTEPVYIACCSSLFCILTYVEFIALLLRSCPCIFPEFV